MVYPDLNMIICADKYDKEVRIYVGDSRVWTVDGQNRSVKKFVMEIPKSTLSKCGHSTLNDSSQKWIYFL